MLCLIMFCVCLFCSDAVVTQCVRHRQFSGENMTVKRQKHQKVQSHIN